jgi:hypothetical protein
MSTHHLYIANPPEHALMQIESYGRLIGLGTDARSVLRKCLVKAWDDGFAEVSRTTLALDLGIAVCDAHAALLELADRDVVELDDLDTDTFIVRPLLLSSDVGAQAGVGWWQRLELDHET